MFVRTTEGSSSMETLKHHSVFTSGRYGSIPLDIKTTIPLYLMQARTNQHPHLHILALKTPIPPPPPPPPFFPSNFILNFISHASKAQPWRKKQHSHPHLHLVQSWFSQWKQPPPHTTPPPFKSFLKFLYLMQAKLSPGEKTAPLPPPLPGLAWFSHGDKPPPPPPPNPLIRF